GKQQHQFEVDIQIFQSVTYFNGKGSFPATLVDADKVLDRTMLAKHQRVTLREIDHQLLGQPVQAGSDDDACQVQQHFQLGALVEVRLEELGDAVYLGVMKYQQRLTRHTAAYIALANRCKPFATLGIGE